MSDSLKQIDNILKLDAIQLTNKEEKNTDLTNLIDELEKIKNKGNELYKRKQIEEATTKFNEGYQIFIKESPIIYKELYINKQCENVILIYKKILSNLALCYYMQKNFDKAIEFDLKLLALEPKFGKSIVRLFNSYSKLNKCQQAVYYGEIFMDLNYEIRKKFNGMERKLEEEKVKLSKLQKAEESRIKYVFIFYGSIFILFLSLIYYYIFK
jgi:tetratricopeptide (TPR) repeat protein